MHTISEPIRTYHHGDLRGALLEQAAVLVALRGVDAFSLREAARALAVSPSACYRHFEDKGALLDALAEDGAQRLASAMRDRAATEAAGLYGHRASLARLWGYSIAHIAFVRDNPAHFRVMIARAKPVQAEGPVALVFEAMAGLVRDGVVAAEQAERGLLAMWAGLSGVALLVVEGQLPLPSETALEAAVDAVMRSVFLGLGVGAAELPPERDLAPIRPPAYAVCHWPLPSAAAPT